VYIVEPHIKPHIGELRLDEVRPQIQAFKANGQHSNPVSRSRFSWPSIPIRNVPSESCGDATRGRVADAAWLAERRARAHIERRRPRGPHPRRLSYFSSPPRSS
jgi:hypothetical protein